MSVGRCQMIADTHHGIGAVVMSNANPADILQAYVGEYTTESTLRLAVKEARGDSWINPTPRRQESIWEKETNVTRAFPTP